jgi:hypothetical protein
MISIKKYIYICKCCSCSRFAPYSITNVPFITAVSCVVQVRGGARGEVRGGAGACLQEHHQVDEILPVYSNSHCYNIPPVQHFQIGSLVIILLF